MTQRELLQEFKQLSIEQQLEMLKAALEIVQSNFIFEQKKETETAPLITTDPLLALAGQFETPLPDVADNHDFYIGEELTNDHA